MTSRRKVTPLTRRRAFQAIKIVAQSAISGEGPISYSELAHRLGMPNDTGRGLGPILDEAAAMCIEHSLPDITACVVAKESLAAGVPMPSDDSFKNGIWPISGIRKEDIPEEQEKVGEFNWKKVPSLQLGVEK